MKPLLLAYAFAVVSFVAAGCGGINCSPCPLNMHPSNPEMKCSACILNTVDGGTSDVADAESDTAVDGTGDDGGSDIIEVGSSADANDDLPTDLPPDALDADGSADADASGCDMDAQNYCADPFGISPPDAGQICSDQLVRGTCVNGHWACPGSMIDPSLCTCNGAAPLGCTTCTTHGWMCSDGGADAQPDVAPATDVRTDTNDAAIADGGAIPDGATVVDGGADADGGVDTQAD